MVASTTGDFPKIMVTHSGNCAREALACVTPIPMAMESPTIVVLRKVSGFWVISLIPVMAMVANTETVAPPSTQEGMVVSKEENLGRIPAINKIAADSPRTTRLTTLVVTTIPTFWLKVAVGSPPRSAPRILEIPYPKIPPLIRYLWACGPWNL